MVNTCTYRCVRLCSPSNEPDINDIDGLLFKYLNKRINYRGQTYYRPENTVHVWTIAITELSFHISNHYHPQLLPRSVSYSWELVKLVANTMKK